MSDNQLVEVYSTDNYADAEMLKSALQRENIDCQIDGENQAGLAGIGALEIKLLVWSSDETQARAFISSHEPK